MDKNYLLRKVSAIHAIKCFKSNNFQISEESFDKLCDFKKRISQDDSEDSINEDLQIWCDQFPRATLGEINELLFRKY